jgi:hypothetical protein
MINDARCACGIKVQDFHGKTVFIKKRTLFMTGKLGSNLKRN